LERMAGKDGVVLFDVELDVLEKVIALEEAVARGDIEIILMLGRLLRLRLDQDRSLETYSVPVLDDQRDEAAELVELALDVGVEQRLVAFASAPQHIVLPAQTVSHLERGPYLAGGIGENVRIRIGRSAGHVAAMR